MDVRWTLNQRCVLTVYPLDNQQSGLSIPLSRLARLNISTDCHFSILLWDSVVKDRAKASKLYPDSPFKLTASRFGSSGECNYQFFTYFHHNHYYKNSSIIRSLLLQSLKKCRLRKHQKIQLPFIKRFRFPSELTANGESDYASIVFTCARPTKLYTNRSLYSSI